MNGQSDDQDLRDAFQLLRRETSAAVTPFRAPRSAPVRHAVAWHLRPLLATGLLAAVVTGVVMQRRAVERREMLAPFLSSTTWQSPTDYLLVTPGQELLSAAPSVGTTAGDTSTITDTVSGTPQ